MDDFSCNGIFANVIYTHSARDVRVHLSLVALPFPSRASGDKICGRYNIRRKVPNQESKAAGEVHGAPPKTLTINTVTLLTMIPEQASIPLQLKAAISGTSRYGPHRPPIRADVPYFPRVIFYGLLWTP